MHTYLSTETAPVDEGPGRNLQLFHDEPLLRMVNQEPARNESTHGRDVQMTSLEEGPLLCCNRERALFSLPSFRYFHLTLASKTKSGVFSCKVAILLAPGAGDGSGKHQMILQKRNKVPFAVTQI
uniref:Uncharacterized protein n=1 Tax=Photinus pyralis TaxID=7054 RepID=A0A1Y1MWR7_PHOPY